MNYTTFELLDTMRVNRANISELITEYGKQISANTQSTQLAIIYDWHYEHILEICTKQELSNNEYLNKEVLDMLKTFLPLTAAEFLYIYKQRNLSIKLLFKGLFELRNKQLTQMILKKYPIKATELFNIEEGTINSFHHHIFNKVPESGYEQLIIDVYNKSPITDIEIRKILRC